MAKDSYEIANIEGKENEVKVLVKKYFDSVVDKSEVNIQNAVDYVMARLPSGLDRVDGYTIEPLLNEVKSEQVVEKVGE